MNRCRFDTFKMTFGEVRKKITSFESVASVEDRDSAQSANPILFDRESRSHVMLSELGLSTTFLESALVKSIISGSETRLPCSFMKSSPEFRSEAPEIEKHFFRNSEASQHQGTEKRSTGFKSARPVRSLSRSHERPCENLQTAHEVQCEVRNRTDRRTPSNLSPSLI